MYRVRGSYRDERMQGFKAVRGTLIVEAITHIV